MDLGPLIVELQKSFDQYGPQTLIMVSGENGLPLTITEVEVDTDPEVGSSTTIWIKTEEF